ncbi:MAG: SHOCT domain-containing protein [Phycisphaerales bacterium]|jgi:hypothetical protein|nr:SHOCT domain-containing protein [Phycisphaerales bacterium]
MMRFLSHPVLSHPAATLAQSQGSRAATEAVVVLGVLIVIVLVGGIALLYLRKRFLSENAGDAPALLLDDLRDLRRRGEISEEEYERARGAIVGRMSDAMGVRSAGPRSAASGPTPARPAVPPDPSLRVARPGYDLTGAPLPQPGESPRPDEPPGPDRTDPE